MRKTITFVGNGNMALAIARGLKEDFDLEVIGRDPKRLEAFERAVGAPMRTMSYADADVEGKTLMLCVKPANLSEVGAKLRGRAAVLYSVLAGTSLASLSAHIDAAACVRAMPNLAASVGASMTALTGDETCRGEAETLFAAIGDVRWLLSEKELDIATALAGSGPAFLALAAEALCDGAVKQGLKRDDAMALMRGLFSGFGALIQTEHPALIKDAVMSPGGTTAAGYAALENSGVRRGFIDAVEAAYKKTQP